MGASRIRPWFAILTGLALSMSGVDAVTGQTPLGDIARPQYEIGQLIPVSCLNRSE